MVWQDFNGPIRGGAQRGVRNAVLHRILTILAYGFEGLQIKGKIARSQSSVQRNWG